MMKMHEEMERNLDLNQVLNAKSAKGANPSPAIQGKCFKTRGSKIYSWETLIADTGCSYNICSERIAKELKLKVIPFKRNMSIVDASGNLLSLAGSAYLFIKTQVLGSKIAKLEVAILRGNSTDREILLSLQTLIEWNLVHPDFPNVTLDTYIFNKRKENKSYSALYSRQSQQNSHVKIREQGEDFILDDPSPECQKLQNKLLVKFKDCFKEKLTQAKM